MRIPIKATYSNDKTQGPFLFSFIRTKGGAANRRQPLFFKNGKDFFFLFVPSHRLMFDEAYRIESRRIRMYTSLGILARNLGTVKNISAADYNVYNFKKKWQSPLSRSPPATTYNFQTWYTCEIHSTEFYGLFPRSRSQFFFGWNS